MAAPSPVRCGEAGGKGAAYAGALMLDAAGLDATSWLFVEYDLMDVMLERRPQKGMRLVPGPRPVAATSVRLDELTRVSCRCRSFHGCASRRRAERTCSH